MTTAFTARETIDDDAGTVWRTLTDWERVAEWMPGVTDGRADGPTRVGMTLTFTARGKEHTSRVQALEPGRSLVLRSVQGGVTADYEYRLTPVEGGTSIELTAAVTTSGAWTLLAPVIRRAIRKADAGQLADLAEVVRARSTSD
jgi:uncharacterized protein YndB with AHSA1/START domain